MTQTQESDTFGARAYAIVLKKQIVAFMPTKEAALSFAADIHNETGLPLQLKSAELIVHISDECPLCGEIHEEGEHDESD